MSDAWGVRTGLSLLAIPSSVIGGLLLASGAASSGATSGW